jgi:hypothetical protein
VFIMLVSIGISTRFQQLHTRIENTKKTVSAKLLLLMTLVRRSLIYHFLLFQFHFNTEAFWMEIRKNYTRILDIVDMANAHFSIIIFISCFNNFYFICFHLVSYRRLVWQHLIILIGYQNPFILEMMFHIL